MLTRWGLPAGGGGGGGKEGTGLEAPGWQEHGGTHPRHPGPRSPSLPRHPQQWPLSPGTCCGPGMDSKQSQPGGRGTSCSTRGAGYGRVSPLGVGPALGRAVSSPVPHPRSELAWWGPKTQRWTWRSCPRGVCERRIPGQRAGTLKRAFPGGPWRMACLTRVLPGRRGGGRAWVGKGPGGTVPLSLQAGTCAP